MQAVEELGYLNDATLRNLSQMRQANKKAGNIGDIELVFAESVLEAWDAKYGKPYLYDELLEIRDKLLQENWPVLVNVGFVTDKTPEMRQDVVEKIKEIEAEFNVKVSIKSFSDWVTFKIQQLGINKEAVLARRWLVAYAESLALHRTSKAPIDEPTEAWLKSLKRILS